VAEKEALRVIFLAPLLEPLPAWAILATGWFATKSRLTRIGGQVIEDTKALDATHRLEAAILAYRHEDLLWHATGQDRYRQQAQAYLEAAQQTAQAFSPYVGTAEERRLWLATQDGLKACRELSNSSSGTLVRQFTETQRRAFTDHRIVVKTEGRLPDPGRCPPDRGAERGRARRDVPHPTAPGRPIRFRLFFPCASDGVIYRFNRITGVVTVAFTPFLDFLLEARPARVDATES